MNQDRIHFDEMLLNSHGVRPPYQEYQKWFSNEDPNRLIKKSKEAEAFFRRTGITFNVYGQADAQERLIPFDLIPRIISNREWTRLSKGIEQRVHHPHRSNRQERSILAANDGFHAARRCLHTHCRNGYCPHRGRRFLCS